MELIRENNYVVRLIRRIPYSDPQTRVQMAEVEETLCRYVDDFCNGFL